MEKLTGITWHEVNSKVDAGKIIIQKKILIKPEMTALELTKKCMDIGAEVFSEIILSLLSDDYESKLQIESVEKNYHYSYQAPNGGYLELNWPINKISAFLRSLDYGKIEIFSKPRIIILGKEYLINDYKIENSEGEKRSVILGDNVIILNDKKISIFLYCRA